jgi:cytoskeletal protein CcmA (bactofilin family)
MLVVDADTLLQGQLVLLGSARIDGRFEGGLVCASVEIGPDGFFEGTVIAEQLTVSGQIVGTARARHVHLSATAIVEGELHHERLSMDETATLVGESRRVTRFEMPSEYRTLVARERRVDDDFQRLSAESRVRRADEADRARVAFERLRARFPVPRATL